ncbi:MAG: isoprenylcysteine carboxylmethyltransferase family protein [candidate division WOR-3 bacterium]|nr:MAG: isoprenylcysteine carboxylmethyltransferase family protein [candidate division WOR-3 bacterium]
MPRSKLIRQVLFRFGLGAIVMGLLFFVSAGTLRFWHAWVFIAILFIPMFFVVLYLIRNDPALIERRMRTREREPFQKKSQIISTFLYLLAFLIPGLDHRFGWSSVPVVFVVIADVIVFLGYMLFFLVLRENSYASRVVEVEKEQKVISTGPYAVVRHPMYVAALMIFLFSPAALGSLWALSAMIPSMLFIIPRIKDEERLLTANLTGYEEYTRRVKYRLLPLLW